MVSGETFRTRWMYVGLLADTPLYKNCYISYLSKLTSMDAFILEGDERVEKAVKEGFTTESQKAVILNLLSAASAERMKLRGFRKTFRAIHNIYKRPREESFPLDRKKEYLTYLWWVNYMEMWEGFNQDANPERIDFWSRYLDRCTVRRYKDKKMLVFEFDKHRVIESEQIGAIYIYAGEYFKNIVFSALTNSSTSEFRSWMKNQSSYLYRKPHLGYWQGDVAYMLERLHVV